MDITSHFWAQLTTTDFALLDAERAVTVLPFPTPGQKVTTSFFHVFAFITSGQKGQVRHCVGRAS
jgi:hypothetical protein